MTRWAAALAGTCLLLGHAGESGAQVQQWPPRSSGGGLFGAGQASADRGGHDLSLSTSLIGSQGESAVETGTGAGAVSPDGGSVGLLDSELRYTFRRGASSLESSGRGYVSAYADARRLAGGELRVSATVAPGRRTRVTASQSLRSDPYLSLGAFGQLADVENVGLPDTDPTLGLAAQRSWRQDSSVSLGRDWSTRQTSGLSYNYSKVEFPAQGIGFDSILQSATASHNWRFSRAAGVRVDYNASRTDYQSELTAPLTSHSLLGGVDYTRRLSRTRQLGFGVSVGAANTDTVSAGSAGLARHWTPSAGATVRTDIGRSWAINGDYNRSSTVLAQAVLQTFYSDTLSVRAGGLIGRRLDATVTVGVARGRTPAGIDAVGRYDSYTGTTQLRWALASCCATTVSYSYYDYDVQGIELTTGFPPRSEIHAVRIGLTLWAPLYRSERRGEPAR